MRRTRLPTLVVAVLLTAPGGVSEYLGNSTCPTMHPVAVPPLEKPFGGEPFVGAENRILVES